VRIGGLLSLVAARAIAQPHDDVSASAQPTGSTPATTDDLIVAPTVRPILGARFEALFGAGTYASRIAAIRASDTLGPVGVELTGGGEENGGYSLVDERDAVAGSATAGSARYARHGAAARVAGGGASAFARWTDEHRDAGGVGSTLDVRDARELAFGGRWQLQAAPGRAEVELYGARTLTLSATTYGARTHLRSRPVHAFGLAHELGLDAGMLQFASDGSGDQAIETACQPA